MNIHKAKQKTWLKHAYLHRSIDVKFIFDSARLGLFSSANILQIAAVSYTHLRAHEDLSTSRMPSSA